MKNKKQQMTDKRKAYRFPCVGIALLYLSPDKQPMAGVGAALLRATAHDMSLAGISFDVSQAMKPGQRLLVSVQAPEHQQPETLQTEVRWCKQLADGRYRVGVSILGIETGANCEDQADEIKHIGHGIEAPVGGRFVCPACQLCSWFELIGEQPDVPTTGIMPLYNCKNCHTTRTITSLLTFNWQTMQAD